MIVFGYVKGCYYSGDGTLRIKVRIPSIHGAYNQKDYKGGKIRNYVLDDDLPDYTSILMPSLPNIGDVVALASMNDSSTEFIVIGKTGGTYQANQTDLSISNISPYSI